MFAPIIGWIPDADDTSTGALPDVANMIPTVRGYAGAPSAISIGLAALAAECRGALAITILDGTTVLFAGTQTKLYKAGSASWTDVTAGAGDYTGSTVSRWCFTQQGNVTLAANKVDASQYYLHGTSTDFAALAGMPKALLVEAVGNFILIGNYNDGTEVVDGWGCSALGDYTDWTADPDTQCTFGRLYDTPGPLVGLRRLMDYAIYYKRRSMYLGRYVGQPNIWEFALLSDVVGAVSQEAVVPVGIDIAGSAVHFFLGDDNFYSYDGASLKPIGDQIKEFFNLDCNNAARTRTIGTYDQRSGLVYWFYPQGTATIPTAWVAYNPRVGRWGKGTLSVEAALQFVTAGSSYNDLDALYGTYDGFPSVSYDELNPSGYSRLPAIFDTSHALRTLSGTPGASSLTSNDIGQDGEITLLSGVRPRYLQSPSSGTMTNYYRDSPGDHLTVDATVPIASGKFDVLRSARWHRVTLSHTGVVELSGADISLQPDGMT